MALNVKIEITSTNIEVKTGNNARGPWTIREQVGHMFKNDDKYPQQIVLALDDGAEPYPVGFYEFDEKSFYVGKYNQLQCRPRLRALVAAAANQRQSA